MSKGVNKAIIIGNLGQDPETKYTAGGDAVTNISVATSESWKDKQGQQQERTEWHKITFFDRLAEIAGEYLKKGSKVYLEGRLQTRKWQNQQGQDQYTTEIIVSDMQMLDSRAAGAPAYEAQQANYEAGGYSAPMQQPAYNAPQQGGYQPQQAAPQQPRQQYNAPQHNAPQQGGYNKPQQSAPQQARPQYNAPQAPQQGGYNKPQQAPAPRVNPVEPMIDFDDDIPF